MKSIVLVMILNWKRQPQFGKPTVYGRSESRILSGNVNVIDSKSK